MRFPLMLKVRAGDESVMLPLTLDPVWFHVSVNVPEKTPLYCPDHAPATWAACTAAAGGGALAVGVGVLTVVLALAIAVGVGVSEDDAPHPAKKAALSNAVTPSIIRFMSFPPQLSV
jgi:hypothetical protein